MHSLRLVIGLLALAACSTDGQSQSPDRITTTATRHQTIEGWGASLTWWGDTAIINDARWRRAYVDLGLNILRIDLQKEVLVADDGRFDTPVPIADDLAANARRMDFTRGDVKVFGDHARWLSEHALEPERVKIVGSLWSPPHWMKGPTGQSQTWVDGTGPYPTPWLVGDHVNFVDPGRGDSIGGRLRTEDPSILHQYGRYVASWVIGFEATYGVTLHAISLQNESTFENPFDSMVVNIARDGRERYAEYALLLDSVRDAWRANGLTTRIKGPHVAQIGPTPDNPWGLAAQMSLIEAVKGFEDETLIEFLDYYNSNYYMPATEAGARATAAYYHGRAAVAADWPDWAHFAGLESDGKPIWFSETGGEAAEWRNGEKGTAGSGAITVAVKMFNALVHADAAAYVYWQFSDAEPGPGALLDSSQLDAPHASNKYVAFKHFSRFVRPGARRLDASFDDGHASAHGASEYDTLHGLSVAAFVHDSDRTLTYVLLNLTPQTRRVVLVPIAGIAVGSFTAYRSSDDEKFALLPDVPVTAAGGEVELPPYSIVTLTGATLAP